MQFEVGFGGPGVFDITNAQAALMHEHPENVPPAINWPAPGPFFPQPSNQILQLSQGAHIHFRFTASGALHNALNGNARFRCTVNYERMGGGLERSFPGPFDPPVFQTLTGGWSHNYNIVVVIPELTSVPGATTGLYRVTCILTTEMISGIPLPVAGFDEGVFVQYYANA